MAQLISVAPAGCSCAQTYTAVPVASDADEVIE
jgi:hypothetical protein